MIVVFSQGLWADFSIAVIACRLFAIALVTSHSESGADERSYALLN